MSAEDWGLIRAALQDCLQGTAKQRQRYDAALAALERLQVEAGALPPPEPYSDPYPAEDDFPAWKRRAGKAMAAWAGCHRRATAVEDERNVLRAALEEAHEVVRGLAGNLAHFQNAEPEVLEARDALHGLSVHLALTLNPRREADGLRCQGCGGHLRRGHTFTSGRARCDRCAPRLTVTVSAAATEN